MKSLLLSYCDSCGGAARAAYRIHHALRAAGIDSRMRVNIAMLGDPTVEGPVGVWKKGVSKLRSVVGLMVSRLLTTTNPTLHSSAVLPSNWPAWINSTDAEVVHLHWINGEMMSIRDIGRIRKPLVWTLHDMWAFCGAEHYTEELRWREGYNRHNRPAYESGLDLNRFTWQRKRKAWQRPMHIVTPSHWLANCVQQSILMRDWPVTVVHNALDTEVWSPIEKTLARRLLGLPEEARLLLFGAMGGSTDPRKGFDLLQLALRHLRGQVTDLRLLVFGQLAPHTSTGDLGFPVHYTGHLHDDLTMRVLYSAADVMAIPSRQDNLPNTGIEALACGTPVIAFNTCGLPDIVTHQHSGYLAKAFDAEDLARGIQWILADSERHGRLSAHARQDAVERFSYPAVAAKYHQIYTAAIASHNN